MFISINTLNFGKFCSYTHSLIFDYFDYLRESGGAFHIIILNIIIKVKHNLKGLPYYFGGNNVLLFFLQNLFTKNAWLKV